MTAVYSHRIIFDSHQSDNHFHANADDSHANVHDSQANDEDSQVTVVRSQVTIADSQATDVDSQATDVDSQATDVDSQMTVEDSQVTGVDSQINKRSVGRIVRALKMVISDRKEYILLNSQDLDFKVMWNERYSQKGYAYGTEPNDFLRENADKLPKGKVLCLAEGEGRNAVFLAKKGFAVTAVDLSEVGLEKTKNLAEQANVTVETVCTDLADFDIEENGWDAIISIWAHVPPEVRRILHRKAVAGLKPNGAFLLEAYTPKQIEFGTGGPKKEWTMPLETVREELNGLRFEIAHEIEREVQEGKYHSGQSAVVQILAFK